MKCSECNFWERRHGWLEGTVYIGMCAHQTVCQPTYGKRGNRKMTSDGVLTMDEGGCTGELCTGPDFGCIHFSRREND